MRRAHRSPSIDRLSRREFLAAGAAGAGAMAFPSLRAARAEAKRPFPAEPSGVPRIDMHVHLDNSTIDKVAALGRERNVKFGIVEHAGTKENKYPTVLSDDEELDRYLKMLDGKGVWCGVQAEWIDWTSGFTREGLARLDHVLMDAFTFPGKDGKRVKLWEKDAPDRVGIGDHEAFMDRFVDWHVEIIAKQPIDILGNATWLPRPLAPDYDKLWTRERVEKVAEAAVKHRVALEISGSYRLPKLPWLKIARKVGATFTFGSNGRYPNMGKIDYSLQMAKELGLSADDVFVPGKWPKAVERRM